MYYLFLNPMNLWNMYVCMRTMHGVYVTFSFFYWFLGSSFATMYWFMTFVYDPYEIKLLEDKKDKKHITNK